MAVASGVIPIYEQLLNIYVQNSYYFILAIKGLDTSLSFNMPAPLIQNPLLKLRDYNTKCTNTASTLRSLFTNGKSVSQINWKKPILFSILQPSSLEGATNLDDIFMGHHAIIIYLPQSIDATAENGKYYIIQSFIYLYDTVCKQLSYSEFQKYLKIYQHQFNTKLINPPNTKWENINVDEAKYVFWTEPRTYLNKPFKGPILKPIIKYYEIVQPNLILSNMLNILLFNYSILKLSSEYFIRLYSLPTTKIFSLPIDEKTLTYDELKTLTANTLEPVITEKKPIILLEQFLNLILEINISKTLFLENIFKHIFKNILTFNTYTKKIDATPESLEIDKEASLSIYSEICNFNGQIVKIINVLISIYDYKIKTIISQFNRIEKKDFSSVVPQFRNKFYEAHGLNPNMTNMIFKLEEFQKTQFITPIYEAILCNLTDILAIRYIENLKVKGNTNYLFNFVNYKLNEQIEGNITNYFNRFLYNILLYMISLKLVYNFEIQQNFGISIKNKNIKRNYNSSLFDIQKFLDFYIQNIKNPIIDNLNLEYSVFKLNRIYLHTNLSNHNELAKFYNAKNINANSKLIPNVIKSKKNTTKKNTTK